MADFLFTDLLASFIVWYYLCIICSFIYYSVSIISILKYALFSAALPLLIVLHITTNLEINGLTKFELL